MFGYSYLFAMYLPAPAAGGGGFQAAFARGSNVVITPGAA